MLDEAQYRLATTLYKRGQPWGLGWRLSRTTRKTPLHYHDGGFRGFNAMFARFPCENAVVIILCNRDEQAGEVGGRIVVDFFKDGCASDPGLALSVFRTLSESVCCIDVGLNVPTILARITRCNAPTKEL